MEQWLEDVFQKMENKFEAECKRVGSKIPYWTEDGSYQTDYSQKDVNWWTNGFWPGLYGNLQGSIMMWGLCGCYQQWQIIA